jgi:hypothetical protein
MHSTRRHPTIFSGNRTKQKKSRERSGSVSSPKFLSVIIQEKIQRLLSSLLRKKNVQNPFRRNHE